jgi:methylenetetrahydrofolate dehydrogenase (NADP+)/methenyltetrahydrofolate cyclohydrolase
MSSNILSGKDIAESIKSEVSDDIARLKADHGFAPCLAVVRVGDDPASAVYVGNKVKTSEAIGLISEEHHLPATVSREQLIGVVRALNWREEVDGILVQLPLPDQINEREILELIDPDKDVDGFHPVNVGPLVAR